MALAVNFDKEDIKLKKAVSNQVQSVLSNAQARAEAVQGNNSSTINGGISDTIKSTARNVVDTKKRQEKEVTEAYRNNEIGIEDNRLQALFRERAKQNTSEYADDKTKVYFEQKKFEEENKLERAAAKTQTNLDDFLERNNVDDIRRVINSGIDYDKEINDIDSRLNVLTSQAETTSDPISYGYIQKEYDELSQQKASLEKDRDVFNEFNKYYTDTYVLEKGTDKEKSRVADVINSEDDTIAERLVKGTGANLLGIAQGGLALFDTVRDMGGELWADNIERSARAELESGNITQETYEKMLQRANEYRSFQANAEENWSQQLREEINYMNLEIQEGLSTPEKFVVDSINGTTNFLMQFALLGEVGSLAMMSVQSGTGKYYELLDQNYDPKTAFLNGALTGFASYMTEKIGMDNFVSVISGQAGQSAFGQILDAVSKGQIANYYVQSVLTGAMAEGLEEVVEGLVDPVFDSVTLGVPLEYNIGDIFYSFLVGATSGALMSGAGAIQGSQYVVNTKLQYNQLAADIQTAEEILRDPEVTPEDAERLRHEIEKGRFALSNFEENSKVAMAVDKASDQVVPTTKMEGDAALSQSVYPEAVKVVNDSNVRQQQIADITGRINNITNQWLQNNAIDIDINDYMNVDADTRAEIKKTAEYAEKLGQKVRFENDEILKEKVVDSIMQNEHVSREEALEKAKNIFVDGYVQNGEIVLNTKSRYGQLSTLVHEITHGTESSDHYTIVKDLVEGTPEYKEVLKDVTSAYKNITDDIEHESVARTLQNNLLLGNEAFLDKLVRYNDSLAYRLFNGIKSMASFDGKTKIENAFMKAFRSVQVEARMETRKAAKSDRVVKIGDNEVSKNGVKLSVEQFEKTGREIIKTYLENNPDIDDAEGIMNRIEEMAKVMREFMETGKYPEFSSWQNQYYGVNENGDLTVVINNGDYELNIDFSTVCKKRKMMDKVLNQLSRNGYLNTALTKEQVAEIRKTIQDYDLEVACGLCFVDSKRFNQGNWAGRFETKWNSLIDQLVGATDTNPDTVRTFEFVKGDSRASESLQNIDFNNPKLASFKELAKGSSEVSKMAKAIMSNPDLRSYVSTNDMYGSEGLEAIKRLKPDLYTLVNASGGASKPKLAHGEINYRQELLSNQKFNTEEAEKVGGVRVQSFSDFMVNMVFDYVQLLGDMDAKQLPAHSYTKVKEFALLFGKTGIKINLSIIPAAFDPKVYTAEQIAEMKKDKSQKKTYDALRENAGLDAEGNYIFDPESFDWDLAVEIQNLPGYDKNVGTICVGVSDKHIRKLLADPNVCMVIPYHRSGIADVVATKMGISLYNDYTNKQNTRFRKASGKPGTKVGKGFDFNFYEGSDVNGKHFPGMLENGYDAKATADSYLAWCEANNYVPKFDAFMDDPNYYKLLIDFRAYDKQGNIAPQVPVVISNEDSFANRSDVIDPSVFPKLAELYGENISFNTVLEKGLELYEDIASEQNEKLEPITEDVIRKLGLKKNETGSFRYSVVEDTDNKGIPSKDSSGRELSKQQQKYFRNSKVVDDEGRLKVVYHGTPNAGFTEYDESKLGSTTKALDSRMGFHFTDNINLAKQFEATSYENAVENALKELQKKYGIRNIKNMNYFKYVELMEEAERIAEERVLETPAGEIKEQYLNITKPFNFEEILEENENHRSSLNMDDLEILARYENDLIYAFTGKQGNITTEDIYDGEELEYIDRLINFDGEELAEFKDELSDPEVLGRLKELGYDGIILPIQISDAMAIRSSGDDSGHEYVVFNSNQAKNIDNTNPTSSKDIRFSISSTDSQGRELSPGQREFFKDSKMVDDEGNLMVMYHGTNKGGFTIFDPSMSDDKTTLFFTNSRNIANSYVRPMYRGNTIDMRLADFYKGDRKAQKFADPDEAAAFLDELGMNVNSWTDSAYGREFKRYSYNSPGLGRIYGDTGTNIRRYASDIRRYGLNQNGRYEVYLNAKNPLIVDANGSTWNHIPVPDAIFDDVQKFFEGSVLYEDTYFNPDEKVLSARDLGKYAKAKGYDGVLVKNLLDYANPMDVYEPGDVGIVFDSNQVKSVNNTNPTSSNDIRFSLGEAEKDPGNAVIREDFRRELGRVDFETEEEMDEYNRVLGKAVEEAYLNDEVSEETINELTDLYYEGVKETITTEGSYTQKEVKDFLKNYPISTQSMMGRDNYKDVRKDKFDKGGYGEFGKEEWNEVLRKNKGNNGLFRFLDNDKLYGEAAAMDTVYQEFLERFPGLGMNPDATTSKDMFDEIMRAYKSLAPVTYREAIASYDEVREDVDNAVEKMVDDIIERKGFQEHMEELDITEDQLKNMLVDRNKKLDKIVEDNEKFFRDNAKQWVPNFQVMKDKFNVIDENILGYAAYDHIFHGEMSEHTKDMLFENIVKNDLARELQGNLANEYIDDLVKYIDQTIELDTNYRSNQKFNDSVAGKTNKILEAYEGKDNIETYDQVENDAKLKKQIKEMRKATREEISDAIAYIMENGKNKVNTLDMKSMWDYGRLVAQNDGNVASAWDMAFNEPFFAAQSTLINTLTSEGENLERVMKETGIRGNTPEAKAVGWIIEGKKITKEGKYAEYGEQSLRDEFGDKADNILKFAQEYRVAMERMFNNINEVLDKTYGDSEVNANLMMAKLSEKARLLEYTVQELREKAKKSNSREIYNTLKKAEGDLDRANRSRDAFAQRIREKTEKGRQELLHKENYFHHVKDGHPVAVAKRFIKNFITSKQNGIPSELIGLTDRTSPLTRWSTLFLHQGNGDYTTDGIASWYDYIREYADIVTFNPLTMYLRDAVAEMRAQDPDSGSNNVIRFMEEWTNSIDNKSNPLDRWLRDRTNPKVMDTIKGINSLAKKNAVMGNVGSAIVQTGNLPLGLSLMAKQGGARAMEDFMRGITNYLTGKNYAKNSPFLGVRYWGVETKDAGVYDNIQRKLNAMMEFGDKAVAEILWNGFYEQAKRMRVSMSPIRYADEMTRRSIAGRDVGEVPLTLQSSLVNLFIPFQVEVNNQWQQMKDLTFTPWREGSKGNRGREALSSAGALTTLVVTSYILNMLMESILGRRPLFDPLDALLEGIQNGDDDDSMWGRVWGEILSAMPGGQYVPGLLGMSEDEAEKMFGESDPSRYGVGNVGISAIVDIAQEFSEGKSLDAFSDLLANFNPIGGGKQVQKTIEGLQGMGVVPKFNGNYDEESGSFLNPKNWERNTRDYSKSGKLRFENDPNNIADYFTSAIGGRWNTSAAREYINSGFKAYSQTNENISDVLSAIGHPMYRQMYEGKVSGENAYKFRQALEQEGIWDEFMKEVENRYIDYQSTVPIDEKAKTFAQFINDQYGLTKKVVEGTFTPTEPVTTEAEPEKSESFFEFMNKEKEEISNLYSELKNADEQEKADILEEIEDKKSYLNNKTYSNYAETNNLNSKQQESFRDAMNLDGLYKDSKGNVTDDNVSGSKKVRNSEAIETRKALEDMGQYDNVLDYIAENGLDYSDFGLSKTVVGWDDSKFDAKYDEMFGDGSSSTSNKTSAKSSTKNSTKTSTGRTSRASGRRSSGSSRSTGQSDFQRHFNSVLARTRTNRYSNTISLLDELLKARRNKA